MDIVFAATGRVSALLAVVTRLLLGLIVLLVVTDVAMRNLARPIAWSASLTEYLLIYVAFLPMPALVRGKGHVCADFIRTALPIGLRRVIEKAVYALCAAICVYLGTIATGALVETWTSRAYDVRSFDMPTWLIYLPMVVGLWLSALEFVPYLLGRDSIYAVDVHEMEGF